MRNSCGTFFYFWRIQLSVFKESADSSQAQPLSPPVEKFFPSLHEVVESYTKNAKDKDIAGKIGSEVLERSRQVIKKYKFTPEDACIFHVAELYPILSRELHRLLKIIHRRMKTSTALSHPWSLRIVRYKLKELFELLKQTISTIRFRKSYQLVKTCY